MKEKQIIKTETLRQVTCSKRRQTAKHDDDIARNKRQAQQYNLVQHMSNSLRLDVTTSHSVNKIHR